jgi:hypothetical protein
MVKVDVAYGACGCGARGVDRIVSPEDSTVLVLVLVLVLVSVMLCAGLVLATCTVCYQT